MNVPNGGNKINKLEELNFSNKSKMKNFPLDNTKCTLQLTYNTKNMTEFQKPVTCIENYK